MIRVAIHSEVSKANDFRRSLAECGSLGACSISFVALYGWTTGNEQLARFTQDGPVMQLASSLMLMIASICLFSLTSAIQTPVVNHVSRVVSFVYTWFYCLFSAEFWLQYAGALGYRPLWDIPDKVSETAPSLGSLMAFLLLAVFLLCMARSNHKAAKYSLAGMLCVVLITSLGSVLHNPWLSLAIVGDNSGVPSNMTAGLLCLIFAGYSIVNASSETEDALAREAG